MKLTRGKLTKLYGKRKQTMKHYIQMKKRIKNKSFRRKKSLNLQTKTFKRIYRGGESLSEEPLPEEDYTLEQSQLVPQSPFYNSSTENEISGSCYSEQDPYDSFPVMTSAFSEISIKKNQAKSVSQPQLNPEPQPQTNL
jgi:hypothetical protein